MNAAWIVVALAAWTALLTFGGLGVIRLTYRIGDAMNRKKKDRERTNYYLNRTAPGVLGDRLPAGGGHRGGTEAHRAGAVGGSIHGAGDGASTGTGARMNPLDSLYGDLYRLAAAKYTFTVGPQKSSQRAAEFGGKEFAAGVARGARSFRVDRLGRLTGVSYKAVWRPGQNEAVCKGTSAFDNEPCPGMDQCGHGFYGYYDGSDDFHEPGMVSGVIEGYGEAVIGTRGFRAMKARIVALHIPDAVKPSEARLIRRNYPDIPVFETFDHMVSEFAPDDGGEGISPSSDPDFWTRPA